jgi:hypothetical protein
MAYSLIDAFSYSTGNARLVMSHSAISYAQLACSPGSACLLTWSRSVRRCFSICQVTLPMPTFGPIVTTQELLKVIVQQHAGNAVWEAFGLRAARDDWGNRIKVRKSPRRMGAEFAAPCRSVSRPSSLAHTAGPPSKPGAPSPAPPSKPAGGTSISTMISVHLVCWTHISDSHRRTRVV